MYRLLSGWNRSQGLRRSPYISGALVLRHFADTDGDGTRDTKRVAISDFGASTSRFDNQPGATVRLASVEGGQTVDDAGFYVPTTGTGGRALPNDVYSLSRNGVVQSQLLNLGEFNHAGTLDLRGPAIGNTLLVSSASSAASAGTGVFVSNGGTLQLQSGVRSVASAHESDRYADMLIVDATRVAAGGATQILVDYDPSDMGHLTVGNGVELVEVRDAAASAPGAFALGNRVAGGAYEYALHHGGIGGDAGDGNWYLRSYVRTDTVDSGTLREPAPELPNYRKEVPVAMVVPALAHQLGLSTLGTYHDRGGRRLRLDCQ